MTGTQALNKALQLLNYTDSTGAVNNGHVADILQRGLVLINRIYIDLAEAVGYTFEATDVHKITEMANTADEIDLPLEALEVMIYGISMLIAYQEGDGFQQSYMASVYNAKKRDLAPNQTISDVWGCGE